jgi:hypothetical protein
MKTIPAAARRRALFSVALLGLAAWAAPSAWAQATWPTKPITLLVGKRRWASPWSSTTRPA